MNAETTGYATRNTTTISNTNGTSDLKKVLIGAVAGAAVGALVGGAFTEKGKKKTSRLAEGASQLAGTIKDKAVSTGVADSLARTLDAAKESVVDTIGKEAQNFTSAMKEKSGSTGGNDNSGSTGGAQ
jgi:gas vesicle protein